MTVEGMVKLACCEWKLEGVCGKENMLTGFDISPVLLIGYCMESVVLVLVFDL